MGTPAHEVRGTKRFASKFSSLRKEDDLYISVDACLEELKSNSESGIRVPKNLWPKEYVSNYGITNFYKCNLRGAHRLLYSIFIESGRVQVLAIDFISHKEYDKLFGY